MASTELLQIDPPQLTFLFELEKQSSCLVHLSNNAAHSVAFKVKTTSPKKYCVRPTIGIIKPHQTCDFTVTMQAQRTPPPDMNCKDKFLIQSAVVPFGMTQDDISSALFSKDSGKYVEETKLRVVFISPPTSPVFLPVKGDLNQDYSPEEIHGQKDKEPSGVENIPPPLKVAEEKSLGTAQDMEDENRTDEDIVSRRVENDDMKQVDDVVHLNLAKELKSRLSIMDLKLREAEGTIMKLNEEKRRNTLEKDLLKQELESLKRKINMKKTQSGFPLLFVCVVALVSVTVGYYIHP